MKRQVISANFMRGLVDTPDEDGLPFPSWTKFYDWRVSQGGAKRRKGLYKLARVTQTIEALTLNGSSQYVTVPLDARPIAKMGTRFTIEGLVSPTAVTGTNPILDYGATTPSVVIDTASSKLRVRVWDSGDVLTTVSSTDNLPTTTTSFQLVRDGTALTLRLDNSVTSGNTGTMSALALRTPVGDIQIGYDGTDFFPGDIDYLRGFAAARSNHNDDLRRFADPLAEEVVFDWDFSVTANDLIYDRSRYGNTGATTGSPSSTTALAGQFAPVQGIHHLRNRSGEGRVLIVAGKSIYEGTI